MQNTEKIELFDFGKFRIDARNRLVWRGTKQIGLTLKEFEVLLFLVENAGRVVEKTELLEAVWKDTFIEEGTLTQNISRLRRKLEAAEESDGGEKIIEGKIIETLPKRGYRFLPAVTHHRIVPAAALPIFVENSPAQRIGIEQIVSPASNSSASALSTVSRAGSHYLASAVENPRSKIRHSKLILLSVGTVGFLFAATLFFWKTTATTPQKSLVAANVVPFSGATGREDTPAFSPDGKQIVYAWNGGESSATATTDIYVRLTAGGEPVRLTETAVDEHYPVFSPDGSQIAFVRDFKTYGEVLLIPALGGTERRVCRLFSGNYSISFAPDGKSIAVIDTEDSTDKKQFTVYLVDLMTGARRRVSAGDGTFLGETTPRFAPDGKSIAFLRVFDDTRHDLFIAPINAADNALPTEPRQITFDQKTIHSLAWSADGATIFFVSFRGTNRPGLWRVPVNGGEPETVLTGGREITNLAVSPDGKTIAFIENAPGNYDIWQIVTDGKQKPKKFLASTFNEFYPAFAPDDSRIVFTSNRSGKNELWMADEAGKNLRQLTKTELNVKRAALSPDASRAAFEVTDNFASGISTVEIETGWTRQLIAASGAFNLLPAWSADGHWIYFTSNRTGENQIWKIAADDDGSGEPVQITNHGGQRAYPAPDGTLFFSKSRDKVDFWKIPVDGNGEDERVVPEIAAVGEVLSWTANRTGIYFLVKKSENSYQIRLYDFTSRQVKQLSGRITLPAQMLNLPIVSPDGKRFLFATDNANASSIMLAVLKQ